MSIIYILSAIFLTTISLILLFFAWKKIVPSQLHIFFVIAGWAGLLALIPLWTGAFGPETGTVVAICSPALIAWLIVLANLDIRNSSAMRRESKKTARSFRRISYQGGKQLLQHVFRFLQVTLISLIAALSFSTALTRLFGLYIESAMALTVLLLPFAWGMAAWWSASDDKSWRPAIGLLGISAVCSIIAIV